MKKILSCLVFGLVFSLAIPAIAQKNMWIPAPGTTWEWQLDGKLTLSRAVQMVDVDLFDTPASTVKALRAKGAMPVCYISVGSFEDWRPDAKDFPTAVLGKAYEGWKGERWLDIRRIDLIGPIMARRIQLCANKGFGAVEPDNMDGYENKTGFPITKQDQLKYALWLADVAHKFGLSIGQKNAPDLTSALATRYDWALTEDCFAQNWCGQMTSYISLRKAVFAAEYTDQGMTTQKFCPQAQKMGFSGLLKKRGLGAWSQACWSSK